jgi:glycine cleavage system H lipoate-binding protein
MKTYSFSILIFCALIFIQGCAPTSKPATAIYVTGNGMEPNEKKVLNSNIVDHFVSSGKFDVIERLDDFLNEIESEQKKQRSGTVDESQISKLGKQFGVQFVCVTDVTNVKDSKYISARLIDVETAKVVATGKATSELESIKQIEEVAGKIVGPILKASITISKKPNTANKAKDNEEVKTEDKVESKAEIKTESKTEDKIEKNVPNNNVYQRNLWYDDD